MPVDELMVLDQFLAEVPDDFRVWFKERKLGSLEQANELADDYALARGIGRLVSHKLQSVDPPTVASARSQLDVNSPPSHPGSP